MAWTSLVEEQFEVVQVGNSSKMCKDSSAKTVGEGQVSSHIDKHVGLRVRQRRAEVKISQRELARALGVTRVLVSKYESGEVRISCGRLVELARVLKTPLLWFFEGETSNDSRPGELGEDIQCCDDAIIRELAHTVRGLNRQSLKMQLVSFARLLAEVDHAEGTSVATGP